MARIKSEPQSNSRKNAARERLVLLDAHAILHRAYHALPEFTSPKGEPTGALFGLSTMLMRIVEDLHPTYLVACFDLPKPTYRHAVYKAYKAKRPRLDEALVAQITRSRDVFAAFSIPIYECEGFEADDILGTIVTDLAKKPVDIVIASGDMDTLQLVRGATVQVYTLKKGLTDTVMYDEAGVVARFGFPPNLLPDYKGLRGDPSDNIIGVPGIGEKTATELIKEFGTIESMYEALKKHPEKLIKKGIKPRIIEILREHEESALFSKELATIRRDAPIHFVFPPALAAKDNTETLRALFQELGFRSLMERAKNVFGNKDGGHKHTVTEIVGPYEMPIDRQMFRELQVATWLLNSELTDPSLDDIKKTAGTEDPLKAKTILEERLQKEGLYRIYREIELPLLPVMDRMKERGVLIDVSYLKTLAAQYRRTLETLEQQITAMAGTTFNINSPRQLGEVLFDKLGLSTKGQKKTSTGMLSTRESELLKLRGAHPIVDLIFSYRELQKLLSTYIETIPTMVDVDNRLHADFTPTGTTTGRMSSQNPNLQNIPIRTDLGRRIREGFVAPLGFVLVALDYSQIELRIAAILSRDEKLIQIFQGGGDIHRAVAAEVFGVPPEMVDAEMRRRAKIINFGILYGMGVNALRENLGTTRSEAQQFYDEYFKNFSGLARYLEHTKREASRLGYTSTLFGRKRHFPGIRSPIPYIRAQAERMAINAPIQGTQADIIKRAMIDIDTLFQKEKGNAYLLLQVHDELVFEADSSHADRLAGAAKRIMESVLSDDERQGVPIIAEVSKGTTWGNMEKTSRT